MIETNITDENIQYVIQKYDKLLHEFSKNISFEFPEYIKEEHIILNLYHKKMLKTNNDKNEITANSYIVICRLCFDATKKRNPNFNLNFNE